MSPAPIVRAIRTMIQTKLLPRVSAKWLPQVTFGLKAYSLQPFASATGNARTVIANAHTAARKCERLLANLRLAEQLGIIFDGLNLVRPGSFVNVDHSDMNGLLALVGAVQTRKGRAIPCMVEATYSERLSARDDAPPRERKLRAAWAEARRWQCFTGHVIDSLQTIADRLGFWPKLVFDRGFGNESLMTHLAAEGATFYIRLKAGRYVEFDGQRTTVGTLPDKDARIELFGLKLRVVRSPMSRRCKQPWYILTNDLISSRTKIVRIYYHRFEIEEDFKDIKHIWELKRTKLNQPNSLKTILWFIALGIALLYLATKPTAKQLRAGHPKQRVSWLRQAYEQYQQAAIVSLLLTG
jgi:RNase P/RNase MRP subunit p29